MEQGLDGLDGGEGGLVDRLDVVLGYHVAHQRFPHHAGEVERQQELGSDRKAEEASEELVQGLVQERLRRGARDERVPVSAGIHATVGRLDEQWERWRFEFPAHRLDGVSVWATGIDCVHPDVVRFERSVILTDLEYPLNAAVLQLLVELPEDGTASLVVRLPLQGDVAGGNDVQVDAVANVLRAGREHVHCLAESLSEHDLLGIGEDQRPDLPYRVGERGEPRRQAQIREHQRFEHHLRKLLEHVYL
mmetsp:Transcript_14103/g.23027  ORF Transcript_14103/g.23027 Transcript_14103/m.23027 type:complete len:248 (+) Transcript_14103:807-1550(+)